MALAANEFQLFGEAMVMSILQGGPAPNFLDPDVYRYIGKQDLIPVKCKNPDFKAAAVQVRTDLSRQIFF